MCFSTFDGFCDFLNRFEDTLEKRPRVYVQNVPVYQHHAHMLKHVWRGARKHGDVLDGHTAGEEGEREGGREGGRKGGVRGVVVVSLVFLKVKQSIFDTCCQFCLPKFSHVGLSRAPEVQQRNPCM